MIDKFEIKTDRGSIPLLDNPYFTLTDIDGFTRADSEISSVVIPYVDGDYVNTSRVIPRIVVIYLRLKESAGIDLAKRYLMQFIKPKKTASLHIIRNEKNVELSGIVQKIELPRFAQGCTMAVTLHCSNPYWQDSEYIIGEITKILKTHYFPLPEGLAFTDEGIVMGVYEQGVVQDVANSGDTETGMLITIYARGTAVNPKITNTETGEFIGANVTMQGDDELVINTLRGQKSITLNGENIIDKLTAKSTFLQLGLGANEFRISAHYGLSDLSFTMLYKQQYV